MRLQDIKNIGHFVLGLLAVFLNDYPAKKLKVIGITGTDGKTTVVNLIYHLLKIGGKKVGMISTVGARINDNNLMTTGLHTTTPSPFLIQKLLKEMVKSKCECAVIEVTSHALDQYRVLGCNFQIGVITNISHEHLDYHKTIKNYLSTKLRLFNNVKYGVINNDDENIKYQILKISPSIPYFLTKIKNTLRLPSTKLRTSRSGQANKNSKIYTYGIKNKADLVVKNINQSVSGTSFQVYTDKEKIFLKTNLLGEFNLYNILAAVSVAKILGINNRVIIEAVKSFQPVSGRMEEVKLNQSFKVFIDFAHTPQAFKEVLTTVRTFTRGKIIHVFSATGKRDKSKRPLMGEISGELADYIILTSEDTYGEKPEEIINGIVSGVIKAGKKLDQNYWVILDRQKAINKAISLASKKDTVIITGVGHQKSINVGNQEIPWSEYQAVEKALSIKND